MLLLAGCATAKDRLTYRTVDSSAMGRPMEYGVYTPPDHRPDENLPLFVFLHGGGGDDAHSLDEEGVSEWLDGEILAGRVPRVVIAAPEGNRGFWANWADGSHRYEDWVLDEVMPAVAKEFHTRPCPDGCHVFGISMGGHGALRFALEYPGRFASLGVLSGPILDAKGMDAMMDNWFYRTFARLERVFGRDEERKRRSDPFQRWRSPEDVGGLKLFFGHGNEDLGGLSETHGAFARHLEAHQIPHRYVVFEGGHRWRAWQPMFGELIRYALDGRP